MLCIEIVSEVSQCCHYGFEWHISMTSSDEKVKKWYA